MKLPLTLLALALAAAQVQAAAAPLATPEPLAIRSNDLAPRQDRASLSSKLSSIRASSDAFFSSVTKSRSTTAFSSATGFACKGLQLGNDKCCDTGVIVNRQCWVVPDIEGIDISGYTEDYNPVSDASSASSSSARGTSSSASPAASVSIASTATNTASSGSATSSSGAGAAASASASSRPSNGAQSLLGHYWAGSAVVVAALAGAFVI